MKNAIGKPYKNIISTNISSYLNYLVLAEYATLEEAEKNLMKDIVIQSGINFLIHLPGQP